MPRTTAAAAGFGGTQTILSSKLAKFFWFLGFGLVSSLYTQKAGGLYAPPALACAKNNETWGRTASIGICPRRRSAGFLGVRRRIQEPRGQTNLVSLLERLVCVPPSPAAVAVVRGITGRRIVKHILEEDDPHWNFECAVLVVFG